RSAGSGLPEPERHAIGFADGQEALAIARPAAQRRRQRPDAMGMVPGIARVRIDLAARPEAEARRARTLDDEGLGDVAAVDHLPDRGPGSRAMLDDAQHPVLAEHVAKGTQAMVEVTRLHPVVQVAEGEDQVGTAGRRDAAKAVVRAGHLADHYLVVAGGIGREPRIEAFARAAPIVTGVGPPVVGGVQAAPREEIG